MQVALVLDRDPLLGIGQIDARDELAEGIPELELNDRLGESGVDDRQPECALLGRFRPDPRPPLPVLIR